MALNKRQYVDGQTVVTASNLNEIQDCIITLENNYVPKTRTVAGKALSSNITLSAGDVGAVPTSRTINAKALTGNITLSAADVGAVPVARTVNGKALSSNITLNAADVGAVPTSRTVNSKALSNDISLTASDVGAVPTSRTVNGKALSSNITLASGDIGDDSDAGGTTVKASLAALHGSLSPWKGKKIVWYGTSISAGGYIGKNNANAIPQKIGEAIGANVINEAIGSSCAHCKQSSMYNSSSNPYAFFSNKFEMASRCLSNSITELQWIIDHYTFFSDAPSSLSDELKAQILANGYESKVDPYLTSSTFPDLFVFEHGFNDVINGDFKATQDLDYVNDEGVHLYSYRSAMDFLITRILNYNYKAKIVIIGNYNAYGATGTKSGDVYRMQEEVAEKYNIPLLKLWDLIGWSDQASISVNGTAKTMVEAWLPDGIHPHSDTSGEATAKYVEIVTNWLNNLKM